MWCIDEFNRPLIKIIELTLISYFLYVFINIPQWYIFLVRDITVNNLNMSIKWNE